MRGKMVLAALVALSAALPAVAQDVVVTTDGTWQELAYAAGLVKSEISAGGTALDWSLTAEKLVSAVPGPPGWQWQTTYENGQFSMAGLYGINETAAGLTFTNLNNNDPSGIPEMFELTGSGMFPSGMGFSLIGTFDAAVSGPPTVAMQGMDVLVAGALTTAQVTLTPVTVGVDVKPCMECPDPTCSAVNLKSKGNTPIAILGSADLDVMNVDIGTLAFEGSMVRVKNNGKYQASYADVNDDAVMDLVAHFVTQDITDLDEADTEGAVSGRLNDGTLIYGSDCLRVLHAGDVDMNNIVDLADLSILAGHYGAAGAAYGDGDIDEDGTVDLADLSVLAANFGAGHVGAPAIPEPLSLGLLAAGALAVIRRRRR